jgi:hypothetical protein
MMAFGADLLEHRRPDDLPEIGSSPIWSAWV